MELPLGVHARPRVRLPYGVGSGVGGYSLLDLTVSLCMIAVLSAIAMPGWKADRMNILTARRMVVATLRLARADAITKSVHYQVSFPDTAHVSLSAMQPDPLHPGNWLVDTTKVQTSPLPSRTQVGASSLSAIVEFNTRGMVANLGSMQQIDLSDSFGNTKSLQVWPSGQTNES